MPTPPPNPADPLPNRDPLATPATEAAAKPALAWVGEPIGYARHAPQKTAGVRFLAGLAAILLLGLAAGRVYLLLTTEFAAYIRPDTEKILTYGALVFVVAAVVASVLLLANAIAARRPTRLFFVVITFAFLAVMCLGDFSYPQRIQGEEDRFARLSSFHRSPFDRDLSDGIFRSTPAVAYALVGTAILPLAAFAGFRLREIEAAGTRRIVGLVAALCFVGFFASTRPAEFVLLFREELTLASLAPAAGPLVAVVGCLLVLAGVRGSLVVVAVAAALYLTDAVYVPAKEFSEWRSGRTTPITSDAYLNLARMIAFRILAIPLAVWIIALAMFSRPVRDALRPRPGG